MFDRKVGIKRSYGKASHDRAILRYRPDMELQYPWKEFIRELRGGTV